MISSSFLPLSRGSFATFLSPIMSLLIFLLFVPLTLLPLSGVLLQPQSQTVTPPASTAPSTSTPSSSAGGVTLEAIIAQLVRIDARLDTLTDELCQVNTYVGRIARQQAEMGGYKVASSPVASEDENDGSGSADDAEDDDDGSLSDDKMST